MDAQGSITQQIAGLKEGNDEAARQIWERYFTRLVALARQNLRSASRRVEDEEDLVVTVFEKVARLAREGGLRKLDGRDDLWQVLVLVTRQQAVNQIKHGLRQKRGGGLVRGESVFVSNQGSEMNAGIANFVTQEPTTAFAVEVADSCRQLLSILTDETMRQVAIKKMEGHTNEAIAEQLDCTERTVERKLKRIRTLWDDAAS